MKPFLHKKSRTQQVCEYQGNLQPYTLGAKFRPWQQIFLSAIITGIMTLSLFVAPAFATGVYEIPPLTPDTWVVDEGEVISRINEGKISSTLADLAAKTGNQVRFVTVHRLDYGETAESFTKALFQQWFPDEQAQANQVILMLDTVTNNSAIVSGEGVKSLLTDKIAASIANETLLVPLRDGDKYNQAFLDASDRLVAVLSGQEDPGPPQVKDDIQVEGTYMSAEESKEKRGNSTAWVVGLLIAATIIPMATYYIYLVFAPNSQ